MSEITACKYCLAAGECTGLCSDASELAAKSYDAGYEKGKAEAIADYEKRLRDEFAMAALTAIISLEGLSTKPSSLLADAGYAYGYADAMMEARRK